MPIHLLFKGEKKVNQMLWICPIIEDVDPCCTES